MQTRILNTNASHERFDGSAESSEDLWSVNLSYLHHFACFARTMRVSAMSSSEHTNTMLYTNKSLMPMMIGLLLSSNVLILSASAAGSASVSPREYATMMAQHPPTSVGCFKSTYPDTTWHEVQCGPAPTNPDTVGNGYDYSASAGTTNIAYSNGDFTSVSGITSEYDSLNPCFNPSGNGNCSNYYSLQINSNTFTCTPPGGVSATCWEQFVFQNPQAIFITYYLPGYYSAHGNCPSQPPNSWQVYNSVDCWLPEGVANTNNENLVTKLGSLTLFGESHYLGSTNDFVQLCDGTNCWSGTYSDTEFFLYNHWVVTEWNVLGYGGASGACINASGSPCPAPSGSPSLTPRIYLLDTNGNGITPACKGPINGGTTGETNNLNLVSNSCTPVGPPAAHLYFSEN